MRRAPPGAKRNHHTAINCTGAKLRFWKLHTCVRLIAMLPSWNFRGKSAQGRDATPTRHPLRIGAKVARATLKLQVPPVYPPEVKEAHIDGLITLKIQVAEDGTVATATLVSGPPMLAQSAIDAVKQWVYSQFQDPVSFITTVEVTFTPDTPD